MRLEFLSEMNPDRSPRHRLLTLSLLFLITMNGVGCEVGRSWFSMSSDSPMPWFGVDLLPRRKTTQIFPHREDPTQSTRTVATRSVPKEQRGPRTSERVWSKELHLPSIPAFFDDNQVEELSFEGPTGPFSR